MTKTPDGGDRAPMVPQRVWLETTGRTCKDRINLGGVAHLKDVTGSQICPYRIRLDAFVSMLQQGCEVLERRARLPAQFGTCPQGNPQASRRSGTREATGGRLC